MKLANVENEYQKYYKLRKGDVEQLLAWMEKQPHLPHITELQAILFLHSCYCSAETTKLAIDNYFSLKTHCKDIFGIRPPDKVEKMLQLVAVAPFPQLTSKKDKLILFKLTTSNVDDFVFADAVKSVDMCLTWMLMQEGTATGHVLLIDMTNVSISHLAKLKPYVLKYFVMFLQDAIPLRLKALHFFNTPSFFDIIMTVIKPFIRAEYFNFIKVYEGGMEKLFEQIPQEFFPSDYGGKADSIDSFHKNMMQDILKNLEFFNEQDRKLVDESKRVGKPPIDPNQLFGMEGSFKKLDFD